MKNKFLKTLSLSLILGISLTGCTSLLPQNNSNPNGGVSDEIVNDDVVTTTPQNNDNVDKVNAVNKLVNDSVNHLCDNLNEPVMKVNSNASFLYLEEGINQIRDLKTITSSGRVMEDNIRQENYTSRNQYGININGYVDNIYYLSCLKQQNAHKVNHSDATLNYTSLINQDENYQTWSCLHGEYNYRDRIDSDVTYTLDNSNYQIDNKLARSLDRIYLKASTFDYDASLDTLINVLTILSHANKLEDDILNKVDFINLINNTAKLIKGELSSLSYLKFFFTRYLYQDYTKINKQDRDIILAGFNSAQSLNLDNILLTKNENNVLTISLNIPQVKSILATFVTVLQGLKTFLNNNPTYSNIDTSFIDRFASIFQSNIDSLLFNRTFTYNADGIITNYTFNFFIEGLNIQNYKNKFETSFEGYYNHDKTTTTSLDKISLNGRINFSCMAK